MSPAGGHRPARGLDVALLVVAVIVLALCLPSASAAGALTVGVALAAFLLVWFTAGRHADQGGPAWLPVAVVLVAACAAGGLASPAFATFQLVAFPIAWTIAPAFRSALVLNVAIAVAIGVGYALHLSVPLALATEGISFGFSLAMGLWITRIEAQSDQRQRLVEQLTAAQAEVAALNREAGTVAERERLARELHDTLTQSLAGIAMLAERARARHPADTALGVLEDAARQAMAEARGLVAATAGVPMEGGLAAALGTLAERFRRETGLAVTVEAAAEVPRGLEAVLLRCAQEGLANVRKHAGAGSVRIRVTRQGDDAVLTVEDDGRGPGDGLGFGLAGMRDRLALVGGEAALAPGDPGAVLTVRAPLRAGAPA